MIFSTLEHILTHISFSVVSIGITIQLIILLVDEIIGLYDSSEKGMIATLFCLTGLLVTRWIYSGHFPLSNLYESLIFLSWSFSIIHRIFYLKKDKNHLSAITAPSAIFTQGFATSGFFNQNASIRNISTRSPSPVVNDARKYDGSRLRSSFMWIIIIRSSSSHYISKISKDFSYKQSNFKRKCVIFLRCNPIHESKKQCVTKYFFSLFSFCLKLLQVSIYSTIGSFELSYYLSRISLFNHRYSFGSSLGYSGMGIILELGSKGNLGIYYLDYIRDLFTYANKYKFGRCKFRNCGFYGLSYNLDMLFWGQSIRNRVTLLWFI
uniref:Cytochrome cheme attachment protein n=1 Tax=Commiphora gileadensis TaxID=1700993 RepID=A0A410PAB0_9ROSI|nr:cytochrome cheme attachment protein [Commiphora gileadensis]QAT19749.1 cytochrome cheme attachment protein [Commiphora gileadensis]